MGIRQRAGAGALTVVVALASLGLLSGCGRSVEAYCQTVAKHKERYLGAMHSARGSGGLEGLFGAAAALSDLQSMWKEMAKTAPEEIRADTETVRDTWEKVSDAALERNWPVAIATMMAGANPMQRVDVYVAQNCGAEYSFTGLGARSATPSAKAPTSTPTNGSDEPSPSVASGDAESITLADASTGDWQRSDATVYSGCYESFTEEIPHGTVLDPIAGNFVALPKPSLPAEEELVSGSCVVAGAAEALRAVYIIKSRTPASGLDAAKTHRRIYSMPIQGTSEAVTKTWKPKWDVGTLRSTGNTVVAFDDGNTDEAAALDSISGQILWRLSKDAYAQGVAGGVVVVGNRSDNLVTFLNARTGKSLVKLIKEDYIVELPVGLAGRVQNEDYSGDEFDMLFSDGELHHLNPDPPMIMESGGLVGVS